MWVLGLTGGIGSGKTAASDFFASKGITVVDADIVAREVVEPGQPAWQAIKQHFGEQALLADGSLNRAWLRDKVFSEPEERKWLESQTHPRIRDSIIRQLQQATSAYAILVSPLLFESGQALLTQHTLLIDVPVDIQIARATSRDQNNADQIRRIIAAQMPRDERRARADDIADNSQGLAELHQQLELLHNSYLLRAAS
ncbi:dephospho-CoA kinase [Thalassolituus hydrocarboniclasticus]|uniref:Dephospho-CoA kinase n=1 Tax=Thalassolituus hydrocarboniclasticus TaxID=2742796 RepID=A0ABY6A8W9_9GAMM|nr:dephospho-CoA kinase [Thalassolituus hydrocarboniclasticus]UXD86681.1 dephospho-CoA kinase [Thalassolituus hydrocarboniclasticus]